jgi:hypothetical protein
MDWSFRLLHSQSAQEHTWSGGKGLMRATRLEPPLPV